MASQPPQAANDSSSSSSSKPVIVACLGGGQLGRMMALEAPRLGIALHCLEAAAAPSQEQDAATTTCPAAQVSPHTHTGSIQNAEDIHAFVRDSHASVVTVEIEHVNTAALVALEHSTSTVAVHPSGRVVQLIQDKFLQKEHFAAAANSTIPLPPYCACPDREAIRAAGDGPLGWPLMVKARTGAYDGRGNAVVSGPDAIEAALQQLGVVVVDDDGSSSGEQQQKPFDLYAEGWIDFTCELAVMVVRSSTPERYATRAYPAVTAIQHNSICRVVVAPARGVTTETRERAQALAMRAIDALPPGASGVFGVELFLTAQGDVLLNEVAPRPHNTGHYTQDACYCSQFENHLRAVCGMPLGSTEMKVNAAVMINILGQDTMEDSKKSSEFAKSSIPHASVHWYGKGCRKGRKMGHINLTGSSEVDLDADAKRLLELEGVPLDLYPTTQTPLVGVIMGSQSDLPTMQAAVAILQRFHVPYEVDIVSAHRTPDKLVTYSRAAATRGLRVIIAGAGGAAHLPGMVAALTPLPVVGVPVKTSTLAGVDSLYSIVQMPRGIPVATVAIGNAQNAGLLAVRILATSQPTLLERMQEYQTELKDMVEETSERLLASGSDEYLRQMDNKNQSVNV